MRNYETEAKRRIEFIRGVLESAGADGVVYGNSGGKDSALVGILCKKACDDTVGLIMPCGSKRNYETDKTDAETVARQFEIAVRFVDLSDVKHTLIRTCGKETRLSDSATANMAPRLRMTALYAVAASENRLVAGTGNRSEGHMGYFTKWGDGACDFNPIGDLTVREVYAFLRYLEAPTAIIEKAPSAGLYDGQTDEQEMGLTYEAIDRYLLDGKAEPADMAIIERYHTISRHKREKTRVYGS